MTPADRLEVPFVGLVSMTERRLAAHAAASEEPARAAGLWFDLAREIQAASAWNVAEIIMLRFAEHLPALHRDEPAVSREFQGKVAGLMQQLGDTARHATAENGLTPEQGEELAMIARAAFSARLAVLFAIVSDGGRA